jgi:iron complex transport system substrate-binding protein
MLVHNYPWEFPLIIRAALFGLGLVMTASLPSAAQDQFPVTVDHAFGQTTIEARPTRIVTLSWMNQEAMIALGEKPVAIQFQGWGGDEQGYLPWIKEAYAAAGETLPPTINTTDGIPFEEILAYEPDLIFAAYSGFEETDYQRLSAIAPTVAYEEAKFTGTWQHVVETAGLVLGESAKAASVIEETNIKLASYPAEYPLIAGKTFVFSGGNSDGSTIGLYIPADPRVGLMTDIGLVPAPALYELPTDTFSQPYSLEQLDTLDADVYIGWFNDQAGVDAVLGNEMFARWAPVAEGRFVPVIDRASVMAISAPSPLSIPWMMDRFVPELAAALEK